MTGLFIFGSIVLIVSTYAIILTRAPDKDEVIKRQAMQIAELKRVILGYQADLGIKLAQPRDVIPSKDDEYIEFPSGTTDQAVSR